MKDIDVIRRFDALTKKHRQKLLGVSFAECKSRHLWPDSSDTKKNWQKAWPKWVRMLTDVEVLQRSMGDSFPLFDDEPQPERLAA